MTVNPEQLFKRIAMAAPGFKAVMDEHLQDNGELLVHVLMADLLRYIGAHFTQSSKAAAPPPTVSRS